MPARQDLQNALPTALPSHHAAAKEPVLPRVICCPRHLSTNSRDELHLSSGSFPLKRLRDVSLARERICGFWSAKAGSRERQRPLTSAPLFHQWGMEGLDMDEKMSVTSQLQVKINVNLNFQPVHGLRALPRLPEGRKRNQKESKQEKKCVCWEVRIIPVETLQKRLFYSH